MAYKKICFLQSLGSENLYNVVFSYNFDFLLLQL